MADTDNSLSSSSSELLKLVDLKLPSLTDENIKSQVQQTHKSRGYPDQLLRQPNLALIQQILKPVTFLVDSILLDKKVPENGIELETSNLLEFDSALSKLSWSDYFSFSIHEMGSTAEKAVKMVDEINVHLLSIDILECLSNLSWDEKAVKVMGSFVFKFVESLVFILRGPNQPLKEFDSSMAALKKNPISIVGSPFEKFQQPLDQLNSLIKITLEAIEYICDLTLLSDTEYNNKDLLSTGVYWAILSVVACYIHITLLMHNGKMALELSHLISDLSHIHNELRHQYTICKPQIEEMEAYLESNVFFEDIFCHVEKLHDSPTEISEFMKRFTYSKDGHQSMVVGSTLSQVDLEVFKGKAVLFFISNLDISTEEISNLLKVHEKIQTEDYYKFVWVPFVLKWTEELRQKFENLKSKMPWYIVCYDLPIAGVWFLKGRQWLFSGEPSGILIDPKLAKEDNWGFVTTGAINDLCIVKEKRFPFNSLTITYDGGYDAEMSTHPELYSEYLAGSRNKKQQKKAVVNQNNPSSGFKGLLSLNEIDFEPHKKPISNEKKQTHQEAGVHQNNPSSGFEGLRSKNKGGKKKGGSSYRNI